VKEKSVKHFTKTLAAVSLLIPMNAQSLGIGELELHSALNQTLNAQIRLQLAPGESPEDIRVRLAPPEKFDQAGVPWSYFLSKIKFQTVPQANGSVIIKVTSREPLTEPFLNFLLEVNWPQGSQFREFTALIDPPAEYRTPVVPSTSAYNEYQTDAYQNYERPIKKPRTAKKRVIPNQQTSDITDQTPTSGEYGPVQENLTLWRIADELGSERNVSTKQMMEALYQANPNAFNNGNINSLKAGAILRIPETAAISQLSGKRTEAKSVQKTAKPTSASNKSLELVAPTTESKIADNAKIDGQIKPGNDTDAGDNSASNESNNQGKDLELQTRIEKLEQQLNMMQELLALKDQQLAKLQGNEKSSTPSGSDKTNIPPTPPPAVPTESKPATEQPVTAKPEPTAIQQPIATQPEPAKPTPAQTKPKPRPTPVAPVEPIEPESDFLSSPIYSFGLGGAGIGLLGLLGWLLWRKHKIESKTNTESMFASASQIKMPDGDSSLALPVMDVSSAVNYDVGTVGESSFISDFTPSDFEAFDTDQSEIDPLSEADVYLAYGRYQQAEELIRQAIKDHPNKDEYKLKLLEIFYANENKERFNDYAHELTAAGKNSDASFWNKVTEMGKEIIPESVLFGGSTTSFSPQKSGSIVEQPDAHNPSVNFDSDDDLSLELDALNSDFIDLGATAIPEQTFNESTQPENEWQVDSTSADDNGLDFDLSFLSDSEPTQKPTDQDNSLPDIESVDFSLEELSVEPTKETISETQDTLDSLESFDFNFDVGTPDTKSAIQTNNPDVDDALDIVSLENFEFPDFEENLNEDVLKKNQVTTQPADLESPDEFDFNFNFDAPSNSNDTEEFNLGVSDLTDMDEFETKIDLAKAYVDMGDNDAARSIAEEVLTKGNPEQKKAAQALLDELT
jgi:pilus assembly protein FimV